MKILLQNCKLIEGLKDIIIENGKIFKVVKPSERSQTFRTVDSFDKVIDIKNKLVIPGMIDPHVHVRDMMLAEKETWETASLAALAGGITTIMDMPNTIPATTNLKGLDAKREAAKKAKVNFKFHLGATENNLQELENILKSNPTDVAGIKIFLAGSSSNKVVEDPIKLEAIFRLAKEFNKVILVHTEMQSILDRWQKQAPEQTTEFHNMIRNREAAIEGTKLVLKIAKKTGAKLYICHVSTKEEIELIRAAKKNCKNIFCEVTPHHLILDESILSQIGNFGKVNPPLRTKSDNIALLEAIIDGTIDCLGTDHAPHTFDEKIEEYNKAPSGFPGLETAISLTYFLVSENHISLQKYSNLISSNAAKIFGIKNTGELKAGYRADLIVLDSESHEVVNAYFFNSKAKYSPFDGMIGFARVKYTFVNGKMYE